VLVSGEGEDCEIVTEEVPSCYWQYATCLDACVPAFYRYDLGDGTALIVQAYQGEMPPGWVSEGQGLSPTSCPAVVGDQVE
jgi:hypothetical protein